MTSALSFEKVTKKFGAETIVVDDVDFALSPGTATAIIGPNGAGKSTVLRLAAGILTPTAGCIQRRRRTASIIELGMSFHPDLTVRDNIEVGLRVAGYGRRERRTRLDQVVDLAGIPEALNESLKHLSNGMVARVSTGLALASQPEVLLVDEVLAVGDAAFQRRVLDRVAGLVRNGTTLLLASHSPQLVAATTTDTIWLDRGAVVESGPTPSVLGRYEAHVFGTDGFTDDRSLRIHPLRVEPESVMPGDALTVRCRVELENETDVRFRLEARPMVGDVEPWMRREDEPPELRHLHLFAATPFLEPGVLQPGSYEVHFEIGELPVTPTVLELSVVAYAPGGKMYGSAEHDLRVRGLPMRPRYRLEVSTSAIL